MHVLPTRAPGRSHRRTAHLLVLLSLVSLALAAAGCGGDSGGTTEPEEESVEGVWTGTRQGLTYHVRITGTGIELVEGRPDVCSNGWTFTIVSRNGAAFTLQQQGSAATVTATIRAQDGRLTITGLGTGTLVLDPGEAIPGYEECTIDGAWVGTASSEYLLISGDRFTVYGQATDECYDVLPFDLIGQGGHYYRLDGRYDDNALVVQVINRAGDLVVIFEDGGSNEYAGTADDPTLLNVCGGGDDAGAICADLPALALGVAVEGELTTDDAFDAHLFTYYDLYALTLEAQTDVTVALSSGDIDTVLRIWDADGGFIAGNDDANAGTLDSALSATLAAACYIVEASSWDGEAVGAYTLTAD